MIDVDFKSLSVFGALVVDGLIVVVVDGLMVVVVDGLMVVVVGASVSISTDFVVVKNAVL